MYVTGLCVLFDAHTHREGGRWCVVMGRAVCCCSTGACGETSPTVTQATLSPLTPSWPPVTVWSALGVWMAPSGEGEQP